MMAEFRCQWKGMKKAHLPNLEVARQYDVERILGERLTTGRCFV